MRNREGNSAPTMRRLGERREVSAASEAGKSVEMPAMAGTRRAGHSCGVAGASGSSTGHGSACRLLWPEKLEQCARSGVSVRVRGAAAWPRLALWMAVAVAVGVAMTATAAPAARATDRVAPLRLGLALDRGVLPAEGTQKAYVRVELEGVPREEVGVDRRPVNMALVIDHSGSMSGTKIQKARDVAILRLLADNPGRVVDRHQFFRAAWGIDHVPNSRTLDQHISQLRKRIERDPHDPQIIRTVHGVGYRYDGE